MVNYLLKYYTRLAKLDDSLRELRKLYHQYGVLNTLKHLKLSKKKVLVHLHSNILIPKSLSLYRHMEAWKVLVQFFKKATKCTLPVKPSTTTKSICCNCTWVSCSCLGCGRVSFLYGKKLQMKQIKNHLKMCLPRLWCKPHEGFIIYQWGPYHITSMSDILNIQLISLQSACQG